MKTIAVVMAAGGNSTNLAIEPGTMPRDIRRQLNLDENYILTSGRGAEAFGDDENLYPLVPDGAKLYASTPVEVGNITELLRQLGLSTPPVSQPPRPGGSGQLLSIWEGLNTGVPFSPNVSAFPAATGSDKAHIVNRSAGRASFPVVQRAAVPYWQERGWQRSGWNYTGYYRSRVGAWKGRAEVGLTNSARLFIHKPPEPLQSHPHWICFHERRGGWYFIHMTDKVDLSSGILRVEALLNEAFRRAN